MAIKHLCTCYSFIAASVVIWVMMTCIYDRHYMMYVIVKVTLYLNIVLIMYGSIPILMRPDEII